MSRLGLSFLTSYHNLHRWKTLNDPDSTPARTEKGLQELFREIRATVGEEAQIVQVVFPNPPLVMQVFLQRVFAQSVSIRYHLISRLGC